MNCAAPSLASLVLGFLLGCGVVGYVSVKAHLYLRKKWLSRSIVGDAALKLYYDKRIQGYVDEEHKRDPNDVPDDMPAEWYEVPADAWEDFEDAIEDALEDEAFSDAGFEVMKRDD